MAEEGANGRSWWRWAGAVLLALLAVQAVRSAVAAATAETRPGIARAVWPGHPQALFTSALAAIGQAAGKGRAPDPATLAQVEQGARGAPLAVQPLLVAATRRLAAGDMAGGEKLLQAAVRRDARQPAAHFLLADLYLRQNRLPEAMGALEALDRRLGNVSARFAPAVAEYLKQPGSLERMAPVLGRNPALRRDVMIALAGENGSTAMLLRLAGPADRTEPWLGPAVERLLGSGEVEAAITLLRRTGTDPAALTGLSAWGMENSRGPTGWRFPTGAGGAAEGVVGGPLRLVYYGREDLALAEHPLFLAPGRYRLSQRLTGSVPAATFEWRLLCFGGEVRPPITLPLPTGEASATIDIPPTCKAQKLQLFARSGEFPQTVHAELSPPRLQRVGSEAGR